MRWVLVAVALLCAIGAILRHYRARERTRCLAHAEQLRALMRRARSGDADALRAHADECHERRPGAPAAEAWFALGCVLLDLRRPEEATRTFQVACHAHPGLNSAILLAFTCLKTRSTDMPGFLRILLETHAEIHRPEIPGSLWERTLLGRLHTPDVSRPGLSDLARSLLALPIRCLHEQIGEAATNREAWAAPILKQSRPHEGTVAGSSAAPR